MRLVRFAPLALAALPAAAASQDSEDQPALAAPAANQPRPGLYRAAFELTGFEAPGVQPDALPSMRQLLSEEVASALEFCLKPEPAADANRRMLEEVAEGECTFDKFEMTGANVSAVMSCARGEVVGGRVAMDGRIFAENAILDMTLEQILEGLGMTRMKVRAQSARVGDC